MVDTMRDQIYENAQPPIIPDFSPAVRNQTLHRFVDDIPADDTLYSCEDKYVEPFKD